MAGQLVLIASSSASPPPDLERFALGVNQEADVPFGQNQQSAARLRPQFRTQASQRVGLGRERYRSPDSPVVHADFDQRLPVAGQRRAP